MCFLATCRRKENHGYFEGSIEKQMRVLSQRSTPELARSIWKSRAPSCPAFRSKSYVVFACGFLPQLGKHPCSGSRGTPPFEDFCGYIQVGDYGEEAVRHCACAERHETGACDRNGCCLRWASRGFPLAYLRPSAGFAWTYATPVRIRGLLLVRSRRELCGIYIAWRKSRVRPKYLASSPIRSGIRSHPPYTIAASSRSEWTRCICRFSSRPAHLRDFMTAVRQAVDMRV